MFVHVCTFAKLRHYLLDKLHVAKSFSVFRSMKVLIIRSTANRMDKVKKPSKIFWTG